MVASAAALSWNLCKLNVLYNSRGCVYVEGLFYSVAVRKLIIQLDKRRVSDCCMFRECFLLPPYSKLRLQGRTSTLGDGSCKLEVTLLCQLQFKGTSPWPRHTI